MKDFCEALFNPLGIIGALLLVVMLSMCGPAIDRFDEAAAARLAEQRQQQAAKHARRQRAAQAMCVSDLGPHSLAVWIDQFTVECVNQHGRRLASFSVETTHVQ